MCDPVSIGVIGLATSLGSAGYASIQASQANAANAESFAQSVALSNQQVVQEYDQLNLRNVVDEGETFQAIQSTLNQAEEAKGVAAARAADAGIAGNSVAALLQEFERDAGEAVALESRNARLRRVQMAQEKKSLHTRTKAAILGAVPQVIQGPDWVGAAGEGFGALAQGIAAARRKDGSGNDSATTINN